MNQEQVQALIDEIARTPGWRVKVRADLVKGTRVLMAWQGGLRDWTLKGRILTEPGQWPGGCIANQETIATCGDQAQ